MSSFKLSYYQGRLHIVAFPDIKTVRTASVFRRY